MNQIDLVSINKIAEKRPVILFNNAGIGRSTGQELIVQLGFKQVEIVAFSMGGCPAQMLALNYPTLMRRLILIRSLPTNQNMYEGIGPGVVLPPPEPFQGIRMAHDRESQEATLLEFCCHSSETSQAAVRATFRRMLEARDDWSDLIDTDDTRRQIQAFAKFMSPQCSSEGLYERFHELRAPVLIIRVFTSFQMLAGHAPHWQYPEEFAELVDCFFCAEDTLKVPEMPVNWVRWINGTDLVSLSSLVVDPASCTSMPVTVHRITVQALLCVDNSVPKDTKQPSRTQVDRHSSKIRKTDKVLKVISPLD
ncbi:Alpha/Beta hydrolase protein [Colletotrichum phormii]|uniref:Alpha/Beta hydrolase protein n=1 Tax=Colletotrichum phormii TaxID=359342 RepID=A0AAJ0EAS3_9PEZI|nr:Alpha/Beta hydrolase protein [Colletotrichum phormii]KAK1624255.1 Alpha/Beta hydrolase protein [Colletotrichum phormii]